MDLPTPFKQKNKGTTDTLELFLSASLRVDFFNVFLKPRARPFAVASPSYFDISVVQQVGSQSPIPLAADLFAQSL